MKGGVTRKRMFEFERGKFLMFECNQEAVAYYGARSIQQQFKRDPYRPNKDRRKPLGFNRVIRKWDIYLTMRNRIGHGHFKGLTRKDR